MSLSARRHPDGTGKDDQGPEKTSNQTPPRKATTTREMKMTKQQSVADAQAVLERINKKLDAIGERAKEISAERQALGFKAHAEADARAIKQLATLAAEAAEIEAERETLAGAMREASLRVVAARNAEAEAAAEVNAKAIRKTLGEFVECGHALQEALDDVGQLGKHQQNLLSELHGLGVGFPSHEQLSTLGWQAVQTALMNSPWHRRSEHLAPSQRRNFAALVDGWAATVERGLAQRLGEAEQQKEKEVA